MKKLILSICLTANVLISSAAQTGTYKSYVITSAGGTFITAPANIPDVIYLTVNGATTLSNDFVVNSTSYPATGSHWRVYFNLTDLDVNGHVVIIFGYTLNPPQRLTAGYYDFWVTGISGTPALLYNYAPYDFNASDAIYGAVIQDGTIPLSALDSDIPLSYLDSVGRGRILVGNSSNAVSSYYTAGSGKILVGDGSDLKSVSVTGDISLTSAGATTLDSATVRDSSIATGAAIKWQKLAVGTASYVAVTNASGVLTTEQYLQPVRGGTGINSSMSTGVVTVNGGTWAIGARTEVLLLEVSFETGYAGDFKITMPFAGTVTGIYAYATKAIAATDNGTIQMKNNAGTSTTNGLITFTASDARGTAYSVSPSANNTFVANDILTFTTAKTTAGGVVQLSITYTRAN